MAGRRFDREIRGHDRAERVGRGEFRHERLRDLGRHGQHDRVARREIDALAADRHRIDRIAVRAELERVEPRIQADLRAAVLQHPQRRFDERAAEPAARDARTATGAARGERAAQRGARELGARVARLDIQYPEEVRPQPAIPQHAVASHRLRERAARAGERERRKREVVERRRARRARRGIEQPRRPAAVAEAQRPALLRRDVHHREFSQRGPGELIGRADRAQVALRRRLSRENRVQPAVERRVQRPVEPRPAAAAGVRMRIVQHDAPPAPLQLDRGRQARESCADHMDGPGHRVGRLRTARSARRSSACAPSACAAGRAARQSRVRSRPRECSDTRPT